MTPPKELDNQPTEWVREVLEPDQLSTAQTRYPQRQLSKGVLAVLWAMRVYVVLMLLLIAYEIWQVVHKH
ncbi:MAG TPA: hypothetical protein VGL56_07785 [Fimbriimonadaceae bacterium]|jgi:hypothetical protein